jgi:hypothetical protein
MWIEDNIEKTLLFDFSVMSDGIRQIFIKNIKTWIYVNFFIKYWKSNLSLKN